MRVLYATDGSIPARNGEQLIASLFDPDLVKIHSLSVQLQPLYMAPLVDEAYELERMDVPIQSAERIAAETAERLADEGFETSASADTGDPARQILQAVEQGSFDLVVLGGSHTTWMGNLLLGSVSMHVLHHAPCPVVVVHRLPAGSGRVLVGVDGSAGSLAALETAMAVLDRDRCTLTLATSVSQPWVSVATYPPGLPFGSHSEYLAQQEERIAHAWEMVDRMSFKVQAEGFKAEGAVLSGNAGLHLLKEADNLTADLVVVGSRGLGPARRAFLGSVSDQVVRHARATLVGRSDG